MLRIADADHDVVHVNAVHYLPFVSSSLVRGPDGRHAAQPADAVARVGASQLAKRGRRPPWLVSVSRPTPGRGATASSTK